MSTKWFRNSAVLLMAFALAHSSPALAAQDVKPAAQEEKKEEQKDEKKEEKKDEKAK